MPKQDLLYRGSESSFSYVPGDPSDYADTKYVDFESKITSQTAEFYNNIV